MYILYATTTVSCVDSSHFTLQHDSSTLPMNKEQKMSKLDS